MSSEKLIQVIYIVGAGRSGSTVLDTVLGNHLEIESVGELINLIKSAWVNGEYCACGEKGDVCPFWTEVKSNWMMKSGIKDFSDYLALQNKFERFRQWPRLFFEQRKMSFEFKKYAEQTQKLFEAIRFVSGKPIIVDSSKNPIRAFALSQIPGIALVLIHLVRDGRGVAYSLGKPFKKNVPGGIQKDLKPKPIWRTALFWALTNLQSEWVCRQVKFRRSLLIRYEDFVRKPRDTLLHIGKISGVDFSSLADLLDDGQEMLMYHTISGNRIRMKGKIRLEINEEWQKKLNESESRLFLKIAGRLMRRYSYSEV